MMPYLICVDVSLLNKYYQKSNNKGQLRIIEQKLLEWKQRDKDR